MTLAVHRDFQSDSPTLNAGPDYCTYPQFRLEVIEGPDTGTVLVSTDLSVSIGCDPSADLALSDTTVAAFQCEIVAKTDRIDIVDLLHQHSTMVNEVEVAKAHLRRPATISMGATKIRFEPMSSSLHVRRSRDMRFSHLVGNSEPMRDLFIELERAAASEVPLLLTGEAGAGKESVALAVHRQSLRSSGPFHVVECTDTHEQVERGLIRAFESAAGGTLYLAHVGEMSSDLQSRLLRVFRNGGPGAVADLRIIASSTTDIRAAVNEGAFDSRLYRHLCGHALTVPALRNRTADLPPLVKAIIAELGAEAEPVVAELCAPESLERFGRHGWPGNCRELREHLHRCILEGVTHPVGCSTANVNAYADQRPSSSPSVDISRPIKAGREEWIKHFERLYLADILESQGGNVTRAAKAAGVDRGHFYRLMMRCGLKN